MKETIRKIDAAQRQLDSAIALWFQDGDTVTTHTLSCSAYQIIHDINQNRKGQDLLLDTVVIKDEFRRDFISLIKRSYNFFKHADKDPNGTIEFDPLITEAFILFSIVGLGSHGIKANSIRGAFIVYYGIHNPNVLTENGHKLFIQGIPSEQLLNIRNIEKNQFFKSYLQLWSKFKCLGHNSPFY